MGGGLNIKDGLVFRIGKGKARDGDNSMFREGTSVLERGAKCQG